MKTAIVSVLTAALIALGAPAHASNHGGNGDSFFGKPCGGKPSLFVKPLPKCPKHVHNVSFSR